MPADGSVRGVAVSSGPTILSDGAGFTAVIFDTRDPEQRAALHSRWAPSEDERKAWRLRACRSELARLCGQYGPIHAIEKTLPDNAPKFERERLNTIKQAILRDQGRG